MAEVKTYSLRREDEALSRWIKGNSKETPGGESGLVRLALYHYMNEENERVSILKELTDGQSRIEATQEQILADLAILKGRGIR